MSSDAKSAAAMDMRGDADEDVDGDDDSVGADEDGVGADEDGVGADEDYVVTGEP